MATLQTKKIDTMTKLFFITAFCAIVQMFAPAAGSADSLQLYGVSVSDADMKSMLMALHHALQPNDDTVLVTISLKTADEMPAYARDWHYAGTDQKDGKPNVHVWLVKDLQRAAMQHAVLASFMLGLADAGYAGTTWKKIYDGAAAADSALGVSATDPYVNRRRLAEEMARLVESDPSESHS